MRDPQATAWSRCGQLDVGCAGYGGCSWNRRFPVPDTAISGGINAFRKEVPRGDLPHRLWCLISSLHAKSRQGGEMPTRSPYYSVLRTDSVLGNGSRLPIAERMLGSMLELEG